MPFRLSLTDYFEALAIAASVAVLTFAVCVVAAP
jgi:hypothetical protein